MDEKEIAFKKELNAQMFGFAHGYIQGLVVVAYAGFFFLWDALQGKILPGFWAVAGLSVGISLTIYTAWEVFAFYRRQRITMGLAERVELIAQAKPEEKADAIAAFQKAEREALEELVQFIPRLRKLWYPAMIGIVAFLALGFAIVLGGYATILVRALMA
jgi:hypothetical protein